MANFDEISPAPGSSSEEELLEWLGSLDSTLASWIGDDTAALPAAGPRAVTMDSQIEGVHFLSGLAPDILARRLLAVNLSDLAAAGSTPAFCFLSLAAPTTFDPRPFFIAFLEACRGYRIQLAGGDLARSSQIVATLTALGDLPNQHPPLRRSGARAGDGLWLGGPVGQSALGRHLLARAARDQEVLTMDLDLGLPSDLLAAGRRAVHRHLLPTPQLELGQWLIRQRGAAAMDISDGLGKDLTRFCTVNNLGARVDLRALPAPEEGLRLSETLGLDLTRQQLAGGEDYVLLFSLPAAACPPIEFQCERIGTLTVAPNLEWQGSTLKGSSSTWGWDHRTSTPNSSP